MKHFLLYSSNIKRDSVIWNMAGSIIMAFQSVILLVILSRTVGLTEAGIFTIAYANANLFLTIGKYGMRYYQVSDTKGEFLFKEYYVSRWITSFLMLLISSVYIVYSSITNSYSIHKSMIMFWMCLFKLADVFEDVYHGEYQRNGRLDIASKAMTIRMLSTTILYILGIIIFKDQLLALAVSTLYTYVILIVFLKWTVGFFSVKKSIYSTHKSFILIKNCFPLFASSFLSLYIVNAPKYAIDSLLTDEMQACYGFISMPVFVIGLLNGFIYNPMVYYISKLWNEGHLRQFLKEIYLQVFYIIVITLICIVGAFFIGIPVLSALYNADLTPYKPELLILLLGGGFLGLSGLLNSVITIIRKQRKLLWGYSAVAFFAFAFSRFTVKEYGILGASVFYAILMGGLCVCFIIIFFEELRHKKALL